MCEPAADKPAAHAQAYALHTFPAVSEVTPTHPSFAFSGTSSRDAALILAAAPGLMPPTMADGTPAHTVQLSPVVGHAKAQSTQEGHADMYRLDPLI